LIHGSSDAALVLRARGGDELAFRRLERRYQSLIRFKAKDYFLQGGESDDLIQEGLLGLYKAIRDYRTDRESSFRNFAELCITRQIITAVKTATRNKHTPLNQYVSFSRPAGPDSETELEEILPDPVDRDPAAVIAHADDSAREATALEAALSRCTLLEKEALRTVYEQGLSFEEAGAKFGVSRKTIDNAITRAKRKLADSLEFAAA
jgi:RNA polymerase sporulation-specific sigma factor